MCQTRKTPCLFIKTLKTRGINNASLRLWSNIICACQFKEVVFALQREGDKVQCVQIIDEIASNEKYWGLETCFL